MYMEANKSSIFYGIPEDVMEAWGRSVVYATDEPATEIPAIVHSAFSEEDNYSKKNLLEALLYATWDVYRIAFKAGYDSGHEDGCMDGHYGYGASSDMLARLAETRRMFINTKEIKERLRTDQEDNNGQNQSKRRS